MALPEATQLTVLYDADCGFCQRCAAALRRLDRDGRMSLVPLQAAAGLVPGAPPEPELLESMHAVTAEGEWVRGGEAWVRIAMLVPPLRPLAIVARLPLVRPMVELAYGIVAANRHRISRGLGLACRYRASRP